MQLNRTYHGVFARLHARDDEMVELYTNKGGKDILWCVVHVDMLSELRGGITSQDLENHEYEILIHFPGGLKHG